MSETFKPPARHPWNADSVNAAIEAYLNGPDFTPPDDTTAELRAKIARLKSELQHATRPKTQVARGDKAGLLLLASQKPVRYFTQIDAFNCEGELYGSHVAELRSTDCVRLQIPVSMGQAEAIYRIDALRGFLVGSADLLRCEVEREPFDEAPF